MSNYYRPARFGEVVKKRKRLKPLTLVAVWLLFATIMLLIFSLI